MTFADFILQHEGEDPVRLLLSRDRFPDVDMDLAVSTLEVRRRLRTKVPQWYAVPSLVYPNRLCGEQCSSSGTAFYKARIAAGLGGGLSVRNRLRSAQAPPVFDGSLPLTRPRVATDSGQRASAPDPQNLRIADLTGGLGVDSWAFSQVAEEVLYNEMQPELAQAAEHNFRELGIDNVRVRNLRVEPGNVARVLDGFRPDVIFLDPSRRAEDGRKVFLIEECQPDVPGLLPELFEASRFVLLKLSPMADITMVCKRLPHVREVHCVAADGECKELLLLLDREWEGACTTFVVEDDAVMEVPAASGSDGEERAENDRTGQDRSGEIFLFEPGKALLKAGAFRLPCTRFALTKLGEHTHLYVGTEIPAELRPFGKVFEILEVLPLNNRTLKETGRRYPRAEVTARNIPMTSELLRKKTGCTSGGAIHLFGVRIDAPSIEAVPGSGNYLIVTVTSR